MATREEDQLNLDPKLGLNPQTLKNAIQHVNPLRLVLDEEWEKRYASGDFRKRSLDRIIKAGVNFQSESNTIGDLVKMSLQAVNPANGKNEIESFRFTGGTHNNNHFVADFGDVKVHLTIPDDAISIEFKSQK